MLVLASRANSRKGRDKARLRFGSHTLAGRESRAERIRPYGVRRWRGRALFHASTEWTALLGCDLPLVTAGFFARLIAIADNTECGFDAFVPAPPGGVLQSLAALYRRDPCLGVARAVIRENDLRPGEFISRLNAFTVRPENYCDLDSPGRLRLNIETPGDYAAALDELNGRAS